MSEEAPPLKVWAYPIAGRLLRLCFCFFLTPIPAYGPYARVLGTIEQKPGKGLDRNYPRYFRNIDCDSWVFLNGTRA